MSAPLAEYRLKSLVTCPVEKSDGRPLPFVGLEDIVPGTGSLAADAPREKAALDSVLHAPGDVLFSKLRPYLAKSFMAAKEGSATGELLVLRSQECVDPRFLLYVTLSSPWLKWADTTSYGSQMPRTSWEAMSEYRVSLPSLDCQRRVADFLDSEMSRLADLIYAREKQLSAFGERLTAVRESMLVGKAGDLRVPLMYLTDPYRPIVYGIVQAGPDDPSGFPYIKTGDLPDIEPSKLSRTSVQIHAQYKRSVVYPGDIVIAMRASIGAVAAVPETLPEANLTQGTARIAAAPDVDSAWLFEAVSTQAVREQCKVRAVGTTFATLNIWDLRRIGVPYLPARRQRDVAAELRRLRAEYSELSHQIDSALAVLDERRQALITAAVTGQIDVTTARGVDV